ncbi:MAG: DUF445 family protein [Candidatus Izimaplasma sp.]|nr:DUF445 family protein [Candidatus Izimaplasma bacterium]
MDIVRLILLVLIGGLIGWSTNKLAIKMLFRPVNPINLGLFKLQGVFPKRKDKMAKSLAEIIEKELLSKEALMDKILSDENKNQLKDTVTNSFVKRVTEMLPPMAKMFLGENPEAKIRKIIDKNKDKIFEGIFEDIKKDGFNNISVYELVKDRIDSLDFVEFEKIIFGLMSKELRFVEIIGLFLGSIIGLIQYFITVFIA